MRSDNHGLLKRSVLFGLALILALPAFALAQGRGRGRGKPSEVFVNGHDARDGRTDGRGPQRRRDRDDDYYDQGRRDNDDYWRRNRNRRRRDRDGRRRDDDGYYGNSNHLRQTALNAGYNEGIKEGRRDRDRGDRYDYRDEEDYRNANTDYNSRLGDRSTYQRYFRQGFANGYRDGYRGY
ncbi:MAG TPA: hypothetical protein VN228_09710 [Pyrinomonadaceae bacterium]|nr:hypothetical protein [Pyrinomonadaceae bacterium]